MFEDEYRVANRPVPKVELVLSDASLLLPPTVTPLTGNVLYRGYPLRKVSLSTVPSLVQFSNSTK